VVVKQLLRPFRQQILLLFIVDYGLLEFTVRVSDVVRFLFSEFVYALRVVTFLNIIFIPFPVLLFYNNYFSEHVLIRKYRVFAT
jgi:hypothetical protein